MKSFVSPLAQPESRASSSRRPSWCSGFSRLWRSNFLIAISSLLLGSGSAPAAEPPDPVQEFLSTNCLDCHSGGGAEAGLDLDELGDDLRDPEQVARWVRIFDRVNDGEMPPEDALEVPADETEQFLRSAGGWLRSEQHQQHQSVGRVRGRRLTSLQVERTLHDLLGVDIPLADRLPDDLRTDGFTTVADGQSVSHFQLERHLDAVDAALEEAWQRAVQGDDLWTKTLSAKKLSRTRPRTREPEFIDEHAVVWSSRLAFYGRIPATQAPESGWYRFAIKAHSLKTPEEHGVWTTVRSGRCVSSAPLMQWIGAFEAREEPKEVIFETWLPKGHMLEVRPGDSTLKMARFKGGQSANGEGGAQDVPGIAIDSISMQRIHRGADADRIRRLLFDDLEIQKADGGPQLTSDSPERDAERLLGQFALRAFRRPVSDAELEPYISMVSGSIEAGDGLLQALRLGYRALLCSPRFLYFQEEPGPLDDYAIASRLSYLLWNRMPDDQLMEQAAAGRLRQPEAIQEQVERMLEDPRGADFVPDFAAQWLDLSEIEATEPDRRLHRGFDLIVQQSMVDETHAFLNAMLSDDLSVTNLIDSDFTFLNSRLARYYEIDQVAGDRPERVALRPKDRRGGVLTQGAILKVTANGTTTSPVIRGVWVGERLLGEHVPPPPESVPAIEPDIRGAHTIREMLAQHRSDASCAACHVKIDPPGFALENYDPAGRWRDRYVGIDKGKRKRGAVIDASYSMADGRPFEDITEFRRLVMNDPHRLARNVAEKLITYGTGAAPEFADREAITEIVENSAESDFGFRSLVHAVVSSPIFLSK